ncbi:hypothetical protein EPJ64_04690 [Brachyspira aalborgi]|uniref:Cyclophilin-like domain-containing protein n=1 Tax=Brachyspira aalborgi TaxID=29522 RepID=A0A5C8D575_9SPIR|nr:hypothetical protein EPJ80_11590 [Brachyspira aalborgi]TXJ16060.1 hypothetical protein EPJ77_04710 [Brachyspira aalborgi]TXJ19561.1 hypothetical protein EPJ64_04690 [Brachyspira aalborgi]TXJ26234.1 hypothetical protein EPJ73_05055 [Brachyspira aalborgi]TXJ48868.1 hypothetical protein EPJ75_04970 [Brachyspira aalborgi]
MRFILTFMLFFINCNAFGDNMQNIIITIKNKKYEAILYDNSTTKELIKKFPITITMSDLNGNEKYYNFSKSFSTSSENVANINKGDIMLFGDNCLVIFYKSFSTRYRYTKLGYIKNLEDLENSLGKGDIEITFILK